MNVMARLRGLCAVLLLIAQALAFQPIDPKSLLVGIVVDVRSENMTQDALLMLRSIKMFGGSVATVDIIATLVHHDFGELKNYNQLLTQFRALGVDVVLHAPSIRPLQQTCNKLFALEAFNVHGQRKHQWFLYLDTDMLIMDDFLDGLDAIFDNSTTPAPDLLCFPSWDYYMAWPASEYYISLLKDGINPPGNWSYDDPVAHCNTGVMFMTARAMRGLWKETHHILHNELAPWMQNPRFIGVMNQFSHVDSWALAVAAYRLDLEVGALPVEWNYLVAAELFILAEVGVPSMDRRVKIFHFLAETSFALEVQPSCAGGCSAMLKLRNATDASPTLHAVKPLIDNKSTCMKLAGCQPLHNAGFS